MASVHNADSVHDVRGFAGVNRHRQTFRVRFRGHRAENVHVHAIKRVAGSARFEDAFDRVYLLGRERIHLLPRFVGQNAQCRQVILDILKCGQHTLAINRNGGVIRCLRLADHGAAAAGIE